MIRTDSWQVEVGGESRVGSRWHLRRVQDFAPATREEGDCDLYHEVNQESAYVIARPRVARVGR